MGSKGSPAFKLDREDLRKLSKSLVLAASGACLPILSDYVTGTDFGTSTPMVTAAGTLALNAVRRWVMDYTGVRVSPLR